MSRKRAKPPVFDDENPEWTDADFAKATRHAGVRLGDLTPKSLGRGRPKLEHPKESIKLRIDADVLDAYRQTGSGWQTKINADLRKARKLKAG